MADKWFKAEEVEETIPPAATEPTKPPADWRDTLDKIVTVLVLVAVAGGIGYGSYLAGGYFNQPTYNEARAIIERAAGPEVAEAYHESTRVCKDGEKLTTACGLLVTVGMKPDQKLASANINVPH